MKALIAWLAGYWRVLRRPSVHFSLGFSPSAASSPGLSSGAASTPPWRRPTPRPSAFPATRCATTCSSNSRTPSTTATVPESAPPVPTATCHTSGPTRSRARCRPQGGLGQDLRHHQHPREIPRSPPRAGRARMGTTQGQRFAGMPQLPQLRVHGLHPAERARAADALHRPGQRRSHLHRLPQGDRPPPAGHDRGEGLVAPPADRAARRNQGWAPFSASRILRPARPSAGVRPRRFCSAWIALRVLVPISPSASPMS